MTEVIKPKEGNVFIATYGSLRKGQSNFGVNARGGGVWLGQGRTKNNYNLYRYHGCYFPSVSLKHDSHGVPVVVEIFEAPEVGMRGAYDSLEGYPSFYNRTPVEIVMDDGSELTAWIYHIDEDQTEGVSHGDWTKFLEEDKESNDSNS